MAWMLRLMKISIRSIFFSNTIAIAGQHEGVDVLRGRAGKTQVHHRRRTGHGASGTGWDFVIIFIIIIII